MMKKGKGLKGLTVFTCSLLAALGANAFDGRIAVTADGNVHDDDDFGATAATLVMLAKAGLQNNLVHYDYSSHIGTHPTETTDRGEKQMTKSALEGQARFNFKRSVFFDDQKQLAASIKNITKVVNASSKNDPLYFILAGPSEVLYRGLKAADPAKRKFVTVVSHSWWNDNHYKGIHGGKDDHGGTHTQLKTNIDDIKKLGVKYDGIANQNTNFNTTKSGKWAPLKWMKDHKDDDITWMYKRIQAVGRPDFSDAGMTWYLLTGDEKGTVADFKKFIGDGIEVSAKPPVEEPPVDTGNATFEEKNGVIIIDAENTTLNSSWAKKSQLADYGGTGYIESTHANSYGSVPENSKIEYTLKVNTPGRYRLHMHTRNGVGVGAADAGNDSWVNINSAKFFGEFSRENGEFIKTGNTYTPAVKGEKFTVDYKKSRGGFVKYFVQSLTAWKWGGATSRHKYVYDSNQKKYKSKETGGGRLFAQFDKAGVYKLQLASRSKGHLIDRIVLYKDGVKAPFDISLAETRSDDKPTTPAVIAVSGVTIDSSPVVFKKAGALRLLNTVVAPANATNKTLTWSSSNPAVATVNSAGRVTSIANGTAVITAKSVNNKKASINVTVDIPVIDGPSTDDPTPDNPATGSEKTATLAPVKDAYVQGSKGYNTKELRIEAGKRTSYLQFNLASIEGAVESMELVMTVDGDAGNGTLKVSQADNSSWKESALTSASAPKAGAVLAKTTGALPVGKVVRFDLGKATVNDGALSLAITMERGGNDVSFASREAKNAPKLVVKYRTVEKAAAMIPFGSTVSLKASGNDKFICADKTLDPTDAGANANRTTVGLWEKFTFADAGNGLIALKAHATGKYLAVEAHAPSNLKANSAAITKAAKFELVVNNDKSISLKSKLNNKFVRADKFIDAVHYPLTASSNAVTELEKFTMTAE